MEILSDDPTAGCQVDILPPEREEAGMASEVCLCCERRRPASCMDEDGCGICEECLSP